MNSLSAIQGEKGFMQININRLLQDIEKYAQYGQTNGGGITRPSFSEADHAVRSMFIRELKELGLDITIDGAANIWARRKGNGKKQGSIVIGSHLDTVPNGGKYDGALGVLMAKEIMTTIIENNIHLNYDLEIVSFTAEESNDFQLSTFGSRAFAGKLQANQLSKVRNSAGALLSDELEKAGGGLEQFPAMADMKAEKKAFLELHIEQGKRLENENVSIAVIDRVVGTYRSKVSVFGQANHSGTTMMNSRKDALTASAEMILTVEKNCCNHQGVVGTVGQLSVFPNSPNIIPGQADFTLEIRGESDEQINKAIKRIEETWNIIADKRNVSIKQEPFLNQQPILLDEELVTIVKQAAKQLEEPCLVLPSMAVHDAAHMSAVAKSVMVFVKSIEGKSHCPEEYSRQEDIEKAGNLLLHTIVKVDQQLT